MLKILVTFFIVVGCGIDIDKPEVDELTIATDSSNVQLKVEKNAALADPPAGKKKYTEAIYADVDPSDNLKIVFLVDNSEEMAEARKELALEIDSLLKDIINSNWRIAVTVLGSQIFPSDLVAKNPTRQTNSRGNGFNAPAPDYETAFTKAINNLREARAGRKTDEALTVFVIVSNKDLDQTTESSLNNMLTNSRNKLVFALLDLEDKHQGSSKYLDWRDTDDKQIIDRYGSINREDYSKMLEEFSKHTAEVLRRIFYLKGYYSFERMRYFYQGGKLISRIAVDPDNKHKGQIAEGTFTIDDRLILTDANLPVGMCLEFDYFVDGDRQ